MNSKYIKIFIFFLILGFYSTLLIYKPKLPVADDMPRHIMNGKLLLEGNFKVLYENVYSYTDTGYPFVNHHWLSGVIYYLFFVVVGWNGLIVLKVITYLLTFSIIFYVATKKADFWLVCVLSIPSILIINERTSLRPEMFSYLFIALFFYFLIRFEENPKSNMVFWLVPIQLLWTNMHIFKAIGIMIVLGFLFEKVILHYKEWKNNILLKKLIVLVILVISVTFINPHGWKGVFYRYPENFPIKIAENKSIPEYKKSMVPSENIAVMLYFPLVIVFAVSVYFAYKKRKISIFYLAGGLASMILAFVILRGLYFFGVLFLISASAFLSPSFIEYRDKLYKLFPNKKNNLGIFFVLFFVLFIVYLILPSTTKKISPYIERGFGLSSNTFDSANFLKENNIKGPIFNDADSGSYLIFNFFPQERVFQDNLFGDAYSPETFNESIGMTGDDYSWNEAIKRYDFNVIFFYQYDGGPNVREFLYKRMHDPEWVFVYADQYNYIFVRNTSNNKDVIEKFQISPDNIQERLSSMANSDDYDRVVSYADIANLIGRIDIGTSVFQDILYRWPEKGKIWMVAGQWELGSNDPKSALLSLMYLDKAISVGYKNAETYSFLGAAYARLGRKERAIEYLRKALNINPDLQNAKDLLFNLESFH
ncbi:MAG: tetratricopeptide repeat protein [Parcubacteria group bacterium]